MSSVTGIHRRRIFRRMRRRSTCMRSRRPSSGQRPAPYFGSHVLLRVDDARAGRAFLRRLTPHVDSAADWWNAANAWLAIGISYAGLEALGASAGFAAKLPRGVPRRDGGARPAARGRRRQRSEELGAGRSAKVKSISASPHSAIPRKSGAAPSPLLASSTRASQASAFWPCRTSARSRAISIRSVTKTALTNRRSRAAASSHCPGQGRPIKAGEFILGYPGEAGVPLPMPQPDILGRNGTYVGFRKYQIARRRIQSIPSGEWKHRGRTGIARREAGRPLAQRRPADAGAGRR